MKSLWRVVIVLLIVSALSAAVVSPAAAAGLEVQPAAPQPPALTCNAGTCQLIGSASGLSGLLRAGANLALTQLPFQPTAEGDRQGILDFKKDIALSLPVGDVTLTNARVLLEVDKDGKIKRLNGSADMPFPTFGLLDNVRVISPARAKVGLDLGKNLPDTGVQLVPDRPYLFFSANTFMNLTGRASGQAEDLSLAFEPGQRVTVVVDTVEPVAYLNGHVTLSITDQIALLGGLLESTPLGPYVPDTLPLRERTQYGLSGKFNKDVSESQLTLRGAYILDAGMLPTALGVDAQLVNVLGQLTISRAGVLVDGLVQSAIEPDRVFDGSLHVTTFIPFNSAAGPSYASLDANAKVPAVKLGVGAGARASSGQYQLNGQLSTPFTRSDLRGKVTGKLPDVAGAVGSAAGRAASAVGTAAGATGSAVGQAAGAVGTTAARAVDFVGPAVGKARDALGDHARLGRDLAERAIDAGSAKIE